MAELRLVDANALPNYKCQVTATVGDQKGPAEMRFVFWQDIEKAPTIDAVPVVRCRDCIHRVRTNSTLGFSWCGKFGNVMRDADFCSWGEWNKDGGAEG